MTTELSPEEEVARSQQEASEAQAADAALQQEAAEQAGRDFAVGADSASDGSLTDASRDSEWDSDGELADTKSAEEEARPGYGVVDMRNAHQVMVITQAPGILTRILDTLTAGVGFWVQLFYTNLRYPSPSAARAPAPGVGSKARQIICKDTEDAARFKYLSSAGVQKATSAQLEYIAHGKPGLDMVEHQLSCAQSALRAFPTLKSLAGDGREQ
eukprot:2130272-Prymnesium_polylepis.1